jgi:hypothetical protein
MAILLNVYSTLREPSEPEFKHGMISRRDRTDPELPEHLDGFIGYVLSRGDGQMTPTLYHVMRHIQRVQNHYSMIVEEQDMDGFADWAWAANALCFIPNGSVCDPSGRVLVHPGGDEPDAEAAIPYPGDAHKRKERGAIRLAELGIKVSETLPPVIGAEEVELRSADAVARRAMALFVVAVRAESLATNKEISKADLQKRFPLACAALSQREKQYLETKSPDQKTTIQFAWRYEALFLLQWTLGLFEELPFPSAICDVPKVGKMAIDCNKAEFIQAAKLRSVGEILDALDLHLRLHWAARQARLDKREPPAKLDEGVIMERHHALNWLVRFEGKDWDDVDTPT